MKQKLLMMLAALMLMGTSAMAQSETLKGDVNGDGAVDVADIAAVIQIMSEQTADDTKYYWYVGQENPTEMTSISPIVVDMSSPGWRLIGTSVPTYSASKMLWEGNVNPIKTGETKQFIYVALPSLSIHFRDGDGNICDDMWVSMGTKEIAGVTYYIYKSPVAGKSFVWEMF